MPTHTGSLSSDVLNAALQGLEAQKQTIEKHIQQVRSLLGLNAVRRGRPPKEAAPVDTTPVAAGPGRGKRSAEARARMAAAQRKRWAAIKGKATEEPKAAPKKRRLSAAGRKRIIEATKKRWADLKAKKAAS